MNGSIWRRAACSLAAFACLAGSAGCMSPSRMPADQAFALSASALAGSDRYSFSGEFAAANEAGTVAGRRRFRGEVAGHRLAALRWEAASASSPGENGGSHPLSLAETIPLQAAAIAYEPAKSGEVALKIALRPEAAKARIADLLRSEMAKIRQDTAGRLSAASSNSALQAEAAERWKTAAKLLDEATSTLEATTVCRWTADRRTWFPKELTEETVLRYRMGGQWRTEKRLSVTNFRRRADGAIINPEEGR